MIALKLHISSANHATSPISGVIFLNLHDGPFPNRDWTDLPLSLLSMWSAALLDLEAPNRRSVVWPFMDGPYFAQLTKSLSSDEPDTFTFEHVHACLIRTIEHAIAHCDRHKIIHPDLLRLREQLRRLKEPPRLSQPHPQPFIQITRHSR